MFGGRRLIVSSIQGSPDRVRLLKEVLSERIVVLDGAMGTLLQGADLTASDFGGEALEGCNENLVLTRPDVVSGIHAAYLRAGADVVETNTFGGTDIVLAEYGLQDKVAEINSEAGRLAREAADAFTTPARPRFVAGAMARRRSPSLSRAASPSKRSWRHYRQQALALAEHCDLLVLETCQDTRNIKAALIGVAQALREFGLRLPVVVSGTIEPTGTMAGRPDGREALVASMEYAELLGIGLNCATGPGVHDGPYPDDSRNDDIVGFVLSQRRDCRTRMDCTANPRK